MARALLVVLAVLGIFSAAFAVNDVVVYNLKLFVEGKEFVIKGFNYQPAPIGYLSKTGLCSPRQLPWLDQVDSACYDSDYYDGSKEPDREPVAGPQNGWFHDLWARDLPMMKQVGANAIRLFNTNPTTFAATQYVVQNNPGQYNITKALGKEHVSFMDYAQANGLKVVFPLFSDAASLRTMDKDQLYWLIKNQIDEVGNHPALLMYQMGNELSLRNKDYRAIYAIAADLINYARSYQLQKWNRNIPFTTAMLDVEGAFEEAMRDMPIDLLMANSGYRSTDCAHPNCNYDFGDLWSGTAGGFQGMYKLSCQYQQPVVIGEMNPIGWHDIDETMVLTGAFNSLWADLVQHIDQGAVGGFFFEWTDEPWKAMYKQAHLGVMKISVNCQNGQCSDQPNVWLPDTATKRDWVYNDLCCGTYQGKAYNFQTDVFELLGRVQATLADAENPCPAGSYTPKPSGGDVSVALASTSALATSSVASTTSVVAAASSTSVASTSAATTSAASTSAATTSAESTSAASTTEATSNAVTTSTASTTGETSTAAAATSAAATNAATTSAASTTAAASTSSTTAAITTRGASQAASLAATIASSNAATTAHATTAAAAGRIRFDQNASTALGVSIAAVLCGLVALFTL